MLQARLVHVQGRVQGVGYRHACTLQARSLGVRGWVRNRHDGSVQALLVGTAAQLDALCGWMRRGPPGAAVQELREGPAALPEPLPAGFAQAPTA